MIQIRNGVFETNSSSTHSIVISKEPVNRFPEQRHFRAGEYGWEFDFYDAGDYLFTAILCEPEELRSQHLDRINDVLREVGVEAVFHFPTAHTYDGQTYYDCFIDHCDECADFIRAAMVDSDLLKRIVFGDATVYTGNDNESDFGDACNVADECVWDENADEYVRNPDYDPEHYDYFYKGN